MINKNNELPSFVNETNLPKIVDKLSNASNIKITGNKYGNRVQTVIDKIVEKADDVTKAIKQEVINDSYSFKVGTGNVDVSADVKDGFGEVGIKGVTYQNVIEKYEFLLSDSCSFRDGCITVSPREGLYSNAFIQKGNLFKPNTKYTVIFNVIENTLDCKFYLYTYHELYGASIANPSVVSLEAGQKGIYKLVITTLSDITNCDTAIRSFIDNKSTDMSTNIKYQVFVLEGDHTNNPNLPPHFEGIVGVGDKSKNLFNHTTVKNNVGVDISNGNEVANAIRKYSDFIDVIPSRYSFEVEGNCKFINIFVFDSNKNLICTTHGNGTLVGDIKGTIDFSKEIFKGVKYIRILLANSTETNIVGNEVYNFYLNIGESVSSKYQYYDGHKIEILSSNKNLLNWKEEEFIPVGGSSDYGIASKDHLGVCFDCNGLTDKGYGVKTNRQFTLKPNTKYTLGCEWDILRGTTSLTKPFSRVHFPNTNAYIGWRENGYVTFTTDYTGAVVLMFYIDTPSKSDIKVRFKNMFLYEGETNSYIENNQDKTQILLDEPLMRLPNGVCDEITRDGKLIKRVGKIVLDGNEKKIWLNNIRDGRTQFVLQDTLLTNPSLSIYQNGNAWCDTLPVIPNDNPIRAIWVYEKNNIVIQLPVEIADTVDKLRAWLSQNPTTVYYELAEPIITELPTPYLRIFKDGHLTFNTLVAPESNHVVQLNKSAQIQNAIKESQSLDNRINVLENNYDNLMLSTISRLNDLELDYTLK